jgi:hypothetical protein
MSRLLVDDQESLCSLRQEHMPVSAYRFGVSPARILDFLGFGITVGQVYGTDRNCANTHATRDTGRYSRLSPELFVAKSPGGITEEHDLRSLICSSRDYM